MPEKEIFKQRFEVYYPMLCRIASGYIPDTCECEDIVQECFIAVWNNGRHGLEEKEFLSYMARAVRNNCISFLRRRKPDTVSLDDRQISMPPPEITDEEITEDRPYDGKLEKILSVLPPRCREIFLSSRVKGMKYQEIAAEYDLSVKTVENQMGKALKLIREQLAKGAFTLCLIVSMLSN